jgi:hypothetical protein
MCVGFAGVSVNVWRSFISYSETERVAVNDYQYEFQKPLKDII